MAPGVRLNFSCTSLSICPGEVSVAFGKRGTYTNTGLPGTGISSRTSFDSGCSRHSDNDQEALTLFDLR
ncbi:MAG: DUF4236 domain-containing protein [Gammaproteobacteria bacterium]|nr:DUF4236 domain-containing protein [Gammaproteobacteria bacterium]